MSCKSALYGANTSAQTLSAGSIINLGSVVRRFGSNCNMSGGNVVVSGQGYYDIDTNFTITPTGAGTAIVALYKDGVAIPGAVASFTVEASSAYDVSIPCLIRQTCCCETTITAALLGVAGVVNNAAIAVEKI